MISSGLIQLLLHLVIVNLQRAKLQLELIRLQLGQLQFALELIDLKLSLAVDFIEADHFALVVLQLSGRARQVLHQSLSLRLVDVKQLLGLL